jgi:hypothetical protein
MKRKDWILGSIGIAALVAAYFLDTDHKEVMETLNTIWSNLQGF